MRSIKTVCFLPQKVFCFNNYFKSNKLLKNKRFNVLIILALFINNIYSQESYSFRGLGSRNSAGCGYRSISTSSILKASNNLIGMNSADGIVSIDRFLHSTSKNSGTTETFTIKADERYATSFTVNDLEIFNYLTPNDGASDYTVNTKITFKNIEGNIIKTMSLNGTKSLSNATGVSQEGTSIGVFFDNNNTLPVEDVSEIEFTITPDSAPVSAFTIKNITLSNIQSNFIIKNTSTLDFNDLLISEDSQKLEKAISLAPLTLTINSTDPKDVILFKKNSDTSFSGAISDNNTDSGDISRWTIKHSSKGKFSLENIYLQNIGTSSSSTSGTIKAYKNGNLVGTAVDISFNGNQVLSNNPDFKDIDEVRIEGTDLKLLIDDIVFNISSNQNLFIANSQNWSDPSNWSKGTVPVNTDNVTLDTNTVIKVDIKNATVNDLIINTGAMLNINSGKSLTINGNLTQSGTFIIDSDASSNGSLIAKGNTSGNVTYKRYLSTSTVTSEGWHLIGAPVQGQDLNDFTPSFLTNASKKSIATYANTLAYGSRWNYYTINDTNPIDNAGNYVKAKGYSTKISTAGTLDFTGKLNTNDESILIIDGSLEQSKGNRWNLISNPYTAAINGNTASNTVNNFLKKNIDAGNLDPVRSGIYLWDGFNYIEKSIDDDAFYIAPGQGFFVHAKDGENTTVNFTEEMQTHQTGNVFLKNNAVYPEIILHISDNTANSSTKIRYIKGKTKGLDVGSDIGTFTGTGTNSNLNIFTHLANDSQGVNFAIQALPNPINENIIIPVGVNAYKGKEITFSLSTSNFSSDAAIFLEDKITNTYTQLNQHNNYKVVLSENLNGIGRFYIHTEQKNTLNTENVISENISIYKFNNKTLRITGITQAKESVLSIYNILGKKVVNSSFNSDGIKDISLDQLSQGVYIAQLQIGSKKINQKIIIN